MKKEIVAGIHILSEYLNKFKISIHPIDVNSGFYILSIENQKIIYLHDFEIVLKWDYYSFTKKHGINGINELISFFQRTYLPNLLIDDDVEIFSDGGMPLFNEISELDKFQTQLNYSNSSYLKIEKLVKRGAKTWYMYFFDNCFFGYHDDSIYLTNKGFVIENVDDVFVASYRTIKNNLKKLKNANIIDFKINGKNVEEIKFNIEYLPALPSFIPVIFNSSIFNFDKYDLTLKDNIDFEPINDSLKSVSTYQKEKFKKELNKIDFQEKQKQQEIIGKKSEEIAFEFEKKRLFSLGHANPNEIIKIVSDNPGLGYDILSIETNGKKRYVEVKTIKTYNEVV